MDNKLIFITGAARSGKSRYAESIASSLGNSCLYVATAEARDEEMRERITDHRRRRPRSWRTFEARRNVASRLRGAGLEAEIVLLDCLSLLISNILLDIAEALDADAFDLERQASRAVEAELDALMRWQEERTSRLLVVSNEVGWGVVPPHRLGRVYRDLLGQANQRVAAEATDAFLLVAGIPVLLKGAGR